METDKFEKELEKIKTEIDKVEEFRMRQTNELITSIDRLRCKV